VNSGWRGFANEERRKKKEERRKMLAHVVRVWVSFRHSSEGWNPADHSP